MNYFEYITFKLLRLLDGVNKYKDKLKSKCNHTYPNGKDASEKYNEWYDVCKICGKAIANEKHVNAYKSYSIYEGGF